MDTVLVLFGGALGLSGLGYVLAAIYCVGRFRPPPPEVATPAPPVTILKPLHGVDVELYENLLSFCRQDYAPFQIVFGLRDANDPAIAVVRRIEREFPALDIALVVEVLDRGANPKVANLLNMLPVAKHDLLVIADSDMRVPPDYLRRVTAPLAEPSVGVVTCLYAGRPADASLASRLGALHINDWFLPSVLVAAALAPVDFCMGSTMALRRDALAAIGGLEALSGYLADDYMLGHLLTRAGYRVRLSDCLVETVIGDAGLAETLGRERRWARTVRGVRPLAFAFSFPIFSLPVALLAALLLNPVEGGFPVGYSLVLAAILLRAVLHHRVRRLVGGPSRPMFRLLPLRDVLGFGVWAASFLGGGVSWRGRKLSLGRHGRLRTGA